LLRNPCPVCLKGECVCGRRCTCGAEPEFTLRSGDLGGQSPKEYILQSFEIMKALIDPAAETPDAESLKSVVGIIESIQDRVRTIGRPVPNEPWPCPRCSQLPCVCPPPSMPRPGSQSSGRR